MAKPPKPTVPEPPLRSAPSTFSALAEAFLNFFPTFATYLDEVSDFTSAQADAALATALGGTLPSPTGHGGKFIRVKPDETGVEFASVYATTATAAGTTTLTVNSSDGQFFTGATTQTVVLPVVSTLVLGRRFEITNNSTGAITVNSSGGNLVGTVPAKTVMSFTCILLTGTTAASWDAKAEGFDITPALMRAQLGLAIGTDVQAYDANTLKANVASTITAAVVGTAEDAGTKSSGTYTPSPVNGNFKKYVNGGAHTLAAPALAGSYSMVIEITNNASAGAITFTGFTKTTGTALTTTNAHVFLLYITKSGTVLHAHIQAMQ